MQKVVAAFRVLAYRESYDRTDEYVRLSRSTIDMCCKKLMAFIADHFGPDYLRPPTEEELTHILARNTQRGLPGCIGSIDCSHWKWTSRPKALHVQYQAYKKTRSIFIEAVRDEDLWIYHWFVGAPGSLNDINILHESPLCDVILDGECPAANGRFSVNGRERSMLY